MTTVNIPVAVPIDTQNAASDSTNQNQNQNHHIPEIPSAQGFPITSNNPITGTYANFPMQPHIHSQFVGTENMALTWRLSKTIKFFAVIDIFFCFLYLFISPFFSLFSIFPILGYYGAKAYNIPKTYAYSFFVFVNLCFRVYSYTLVNTVGGLLLCLLSIIVDIWILRIICFFIKSIKGLTTDELLQIREPNWAPLQTSLVWV